MANLFALNNGSTDKHNIKARLWVKPGVFSPMHDVALTVAVGQFAAVTVPDLSGAVSVMFYWEKRPTTGVVLKEAALARFSSGNPDAVLAWDMSDGYYDAPAGYELVSCYATKAKASGAAKPAIESLPERHGT